MSPEEAMAAAHDDADMPEGDFGPFNPDRVCSSIDRASEDVLPETSIELEIEDKVLRDADGLLESVRVVCPEYLDVAKRVIKERREYEEMLG